MFLELFKYLTVYINIDLGVVGQDIGSVPISLGSDGELGCLPWLNVVGCVTPEKVSKCEFSWLN